MENSTVSSIQNTTLPHESEEGHISLLENETGGIVGAVFGILFCIAISIAAMYVYRKHRRRLNEEYERELHVLRSSHNNAGVYRDTTVPTDAKDSLVLGKRPMKSDVHSSLTKNPDLCESDDEF